ncbi:MAG: sensor histidine kinase [Candidatus Promineifilaceae bacterium]
MAYIHQFSQRLTALVAKNIFLSAPNQQNATALEEDAYQSSVAPVLQQGRERIIIVMGRASSLIGVLLFTLYLFADLPKYPIITALYALVLCGLLFTSFKRDISFMVRFRAFGAGMYAVAIVDILGYGIWVLGPLFLIVLSVYALTLVGTRTGAFTILLGSLTIFAFGTLMSSGMYTPPLSPFDQSDLSMMNSLIWALNYAFAATFALVIINAFHGFIHRAWQHERGAVIALNQKASQLHVSLTREKQLAVALQQSLDNEHRLSELRTQIVNTISHEFRTPLTTISSSNALLQNYSERMSAEKQAKLYQRVQDAVNRLTLFMEDITTVIRADEIGKSSQMTTIPVNALAQQLKSVISRHPQYAKMTFHYAADDDTTFGTDPALVSQVCQILIDNAAKFESSYVDIRLRYENNHLVLKITDDGIGIPANEEANVFGLLNRGSNTEFISGLGIGLFLAKNIVELLNGEITIADDKNTVFIVTLPTALPSS